MNIARNKQSRQTARPPRCIRGCSGFLFGNHSSMYLQLWAIALLVLTPAVAVGQLGQAPMQNDGLVDRAAQGIGNLNAGGAGRMYYGVNGADRGLGYRGSYMTLGGYFPALEELKRSTFSSVSMMFCTTHHTLISSIFFFLAQH